MFYNRLEQGIKLQSDATVAYANNITGRVSTTDAERALDSPYNTYYVKGLPVGPITSPSKKSIEAALHPADGDWLYFTVVNLDTGETAVRRRPQRAQRQRRRSCRRGARQRREQEEVLR